MSYIMQAVIGQHHYTIDMGKGYSANELAAAKQRIRSNHIKQWGKPKKGQRFKFEVRYI